MPNQVIFEHGSPFGAFDLSFQISHDPWIRFVQRNIPKIGQATSKLMEGLIKVLVVWDSINAEESCDIAWMVAAGGKSDFASKTMAGKGSH